MILDFVRRAGESFSPEAYLALTRIEGTLWTLADFVIVYYLLQIANLLRAYIGRRCHRVSYYILAGTVPFALILPVASNGAAFFRLELLVTIPHFSLILYVCINDIGIAARAFYALQQTGSAPSDTR
ncbi:MAG: hypothetical protein QGG73_02065 [Candidatus Hydrogenedentes bacterium]|jgi:hypothetical protein|nr:hypothetical protein [Candidatus Hydrogenedentota bacterium]